MAITYGSGIITVVGGYDSGTATSGTTTSLVNTGKSLTTNAHAGRAIWIYEGTGAGQRRRIASNTATAYVPNYAFTTAPDATSKYLISYNETDILAADIAGAWGVFTKTGQQYNCASALQIGDGTNWSFFASYSTQYQFSTYKTSGMVLSGTGRVGWNGQVKQKALAVFGEVTSDTGKTAMKGCSLYYDMAVAFVEFLCSTGTGQIDFHASSVSGKNQGYFGGAYFSAGGGVKSYWANYACDLSIYANAGVDSVCEIYYPVVSADKIANSIGIRVDGTLVGPRVFHTTLGFTGGGIASRSQVYDRAYGRNITNTVRTAAFATAGNYYMRDCDFDVWQVRNDAGAWTGVMQRIWSLNYTTGLVGDRIALVQPSGNVALNEITDSSGKLLNQEYIEATWNASNLVTPISYGTPTLRIRKYGYLQVERPVSIAGPVVETISRDVNQYLVANEATALGYAVTINGAAKTIATNTSAQNLYDHSQWWVAQSANVVYAEPIDSDGSTLRFASGWVFTPGAAFDYGSLRVAGGTIAFGTPGTLSPRLGAITIRFTAAGTYAMGDADFGGAVTLTNTSGGAVTVELPAGVDYTNTGPSITVVEPQIYQSITVSGGVAGTTVQIFDLNGRGELANLVPTSWPYTWTDSIPYAADIRFRVRAGKVGKLLVTQEAGTATSAAPSVGFLLAQSDATVYNSKGIDGSAVTGISIVDGTLTIELSSGTLVSTARGFKIRVDAWKIFAYASWWETTEEGIRDEVRTVDAPDGANIRIYSMGLKNTSDPSYTVEIYGAYVVDAVTGYSADLNDPSGGNISYAPDHVVVQYVDLAPGSSVVTGDISDVAAQCQSALTAQGLTTTRAAKLDKLDANVSSAGGATALEIRSELAVELARIDVAVSTVGGASLAEIEASTTLAKEATVASRLAASAYTAPDNAGISAINSRLPVNPAAVSDVQVSGGFTAEDRITLQAALPAADYVAPENAAILALPTLAAIEASSLAKQEKLDAIDLRLPTAPAAVSDVQVTVNGGATAAEVWANASRTLTADPGASAHATTQTVLAAVKAKTDALTITSGNINANIEAVNGQPINGTGTESDPWRPA